MDELIVLLGQLLHELLVNLLAGMVVDWPFPRRSSPESDDLRAACTAWIVTGMLLGLLSLAFLPHSWIRSPSLRIVSLILSPVLSGVVSLLVARARAIPEFRRWNHFWYGFSFTSGWVAVRFVSALVS